MAAQKYRQAFCTGLIYIQIDLRDGCFRQRFCPGIRDYSDNGNPGRFRSRALEALAQGILAGPVGTREGFINHRDLRGVVGIQFIEQAAAEKRDSQQVKIFWRHARPPDYGRLAAANVMTLEREEELAFGDEL